jgi:hypothetical protein
MLTIEIHGKVNYSFPCACHKGICGSRSKTPLILASDFDRGGRLASRLGPSKSGIH